VQEWYERSLCPKPVVPRVVRKPVVLKPRCGQRGHVLGVVQLKARYAGRDPVRSVMVTARPSCRRGSVRVWLAYAVDNPRESGRSAEHAVAADRCAREIVRF